MRIRHNTTGSESFETMVRAEITALENCVHNQTSSVQGDVDSCFCQPEANATPGYLVDSFFDRHLLRWLRHFDSTNFLFLSSEDFQDSTLEVMRAVEDFAGLPPHDYGQVITERMNARPEAQAGSESSFFPLDLKRELTALFDRAIENTMALTGIDLANSETQL